MDADPGEICFAFHWAGILFGRHWPNKRGHSLREKAWAKIMDLNDITEILNASVKIDIEQTYLVPLVEAPAGMVNVAQFDRFVDLAEKVLNTG